MDRLDNTIRPYAWGSTTAIPRLLGVEPTGEPQAEMWMGAHPGAPSRTLRGPLTEVIDEAPEKELGPAAVAKFGPRLPFLLKLLAAGAPLSLQVHPDLAQAREGYEDEERRGVPIDAPHRNYKDANHKPELICALTEFDGLCGFRAPAEAAGLLAALDVDSLKPYVDLLHAHPEEAALREVLTAVLSADREQMAATVTEAAAACARLGGAHAPYADLAHHYPGDPGVIAAMLLNHVRLQPGEALFLGAGVPHAYLNGLGVEIMANSDNVLRCGLTPKHVDVPELLRIVRFEASDPGVLRPEASPDGEEVYETPIDEFRLSRYALVAGAPVHDLTLGTPQILLCTAGSVQAGEHALGPGRSVFVPAGEKAEVSGDGTVFRATVIA
ncbi:mannose-6-phosphate isomerase [Streptomyces umbrinus]|uniref:mannose-6-phosphate isomerase, class I n=1 Tax=Streptomyces umbrinus TaxID=67370 RepID=UPI0016757AC9|nr:mannose-6-phosphate isomerase, class I [Streptomyces umbrinus]MCR3730105.1 mannose-6-phosphate isomerase [Streptomyces umbrinus]MCX4558472.1 mannose-6-phosphate isomerase, class I [Streptomyces phaeochromogenes]GHB92680.1 mannose-6-phosphate isomerase, class I [Streptomyces umbrinus]GHH59106.1 mannose-6-phosphate isomerase, class I [Streptomyces umbrinus]